MAGGAWEKLTPAEKIAVRGRTLMSPMGYELITEELFGGLGGTVAKKKLAKEIRIAAEQKERPINILGVSFLPRGMTEALESPVVHAELSLLYPLAAGKVGPLLTGSKIVKPLIGFAGKYPKVSSMAGKALWAPYAISEGFPVVQAAATGKYKMAVSRGLMAGFDIGLYKAGSAISGKQFQRGILKKSIKQLPKTGKVSQESYKTMMKELGAVKPKALKTPLGKLDFKGRAALPGESPKILKKFLKKHSKRIYIGGSTSGEAIGVQRSYLKSDIDSYLMATKRSFKKVSQPLAKELSESLRKGGFPAYVRYGKEGAPIVKIAGTGEKIIIMQPWEKMSAHIEQVSGWYSPVIRQYKKTSEGLRILSPYTQAQRKIVGMHLQPKARWEKDMLDFTKMMSIFREQSTSMKGSLSLGRAVSPTKTITTIFPGMRPTPSYPTYTRIPKTPAYAKIPRQSVYPRIPKPVKYPGIKPFVKYPPIKKPTPKKYPPRKKPASYPPTKITPVPPPIGRPPPKPPPTKYPPRKKTPYYPPPIPPIKPPPPIILVPGMPPGRPSTQPPPVRAFIDIRRLKKPPKKPKKKKLKRKFKYTPTLTGILLGRYAPKAPKTSITGFGIRPMIRQLRKKKRK